jgi:hypothetical protein
VLDSSTLVASLIAMRIRFSSERRGHLPQRRVLIGAPQLALEPSPNPFAEAPVEVFAQSASDCRRPKSNVMNLSFSLKLGEPLASPSA